MARMAKARSRDGKPDPALRLDDAIRDKLRAVVLDANIYSYARPDLDNVESMALRLHGVGLETWIPEPVAWEWAEHLALDWNSVTFAMAAERKNLRRGRIPMPTPSHRDESAVIEAFMDAIRRVPHVRLITATPHNALEGLKDQVMQRTPGRRKGEATDKVKTGASDSTWLRDVIEVADGSVDRLLVLSEDKDVTRTCEAWGLPGMLTRKRTELGATLFDVTVDDGHVTRAMMRYLLGKFPIRLGADTAEGGAQFDIGNTPGLNSTIEHDDEGGERRVYSAEVTGLSRLAGIGKVTVESTPDDTTSPLRPHGPNDLGPACHHRALATVYFLGDVEATINRVDSAEETTRVTYLDAVIRTDLAFDLTDGVITHVSPEADAEVFLPGGGYPEDDSAHDDLFHVLSLVPGLLLPDDFEPTTDHTAHNLTINGHEAEPTFTWLPHDHWRFSLELDGDSAELSCYYDETAWGGGRDGGHMWDPYLVVVEEGTLSPGNPIYSIAAWIIERLDWTTAPYTAATESDQEEEDGAEPAST